MTPIYAALSEYKLNGENGLFRRDEQPQVRRGIGFDSRRHLLAVGQFLDALRHKRIQFAGADETILEQIGFAVQTLQQRFGECAVFKFVEFDRNLAAGRRREHHRALSRFC